MTATAPEPGGGGAGGGGNILTRRYGGIPGWGYVAAVAVGVVFVVVWRGRKGSSSSTTATDTSAADSGASDTTAQYEQLNSELTGLSGQDAAILAAVKDSQGDGSTGGVKTVPEVTGDTPAAARSKIIAAGFKYEQSPANARAGEVVKSQDPPGGSKAKAGSTVRVGLGSRRRRETAGTRGPTGPPDRVGS